MPILLLLLLGASPALSGPRADLHTTATPTKDQVLVNGKALTAAQRQTFLQLYGRPAQPGNWWYDPVSGLMGPWGGPPVGQLLPGGTDWGTAPADASGGATLVFLNGRRIHPAELAWLTRRVGPVTPGRYWMDAFGNMGIVGSPVALVNLVALARTAPPSGDEGGNTFHHSDSTGGTISTSGNSGYIMFDDGSGVSW